jgi:hypothetical protein
MWYAKGMRHRPQAHITREICRYDRIVCNYQDPCSTRPTMLPVVLAAIHYWLLHTPSDAPPSPTHLSSSIRKYAWGRGSVRLSSTPGMYRQVRYSLGLV